MVYIDGWLIYIINYKIYLIFCLVYCIIYKYKEGDKNEKKYLQFFHYISILSISCVYAVNTKKNNEIISQETKSKLVEIKDKEVNSMEDYKGSIW